MATVPPKMVSGMIRPLHASINSHGDSRYKAPELHAAAELGGNAEDYLVLLKVLYSEHSMRLNFIVHREDLTLGRFDRIYCIYDY